MKIQLFRKQMNTEANFLVSYGLHHFVTHIQSSRRHLFFIRGAESQKMIDHANKLIKGRYGEIADIQVT